MLRMSNSLHPPDTADICLLLRAHGEQLWLISRVLPLVQVLERRELAEEQLAPALALLEVWWIEARSRARESDVALGRLRPAFGSATGTLCEHARRYHAAVRRVRTSLGRRVERLLAVPGEPAAIEHASS
jgi:hypothetical protein